MLLQKRQYVGDEIGVGSYLEVWIGAHDRDDDNRFRYLGSGELIPDGDTLWFHPPSSASYYPSYVNGNCVKMYSWSGGVKYSRDTCSEEKGFVCEAIVY